LATTLHRQLKDRCRVFPAPFDVILATDHDFQNARTVLQPDITVVCDAEKLKTGGCFGAPDLVIEIISPSTVRRDLHEKLKLYEAFGVPEYWIVHPRDKTLVILSPGPDGRYQTSSLMTSGDTVHSRIFSGLQIDLEELFTDVVREPDPLYGGHVIRIA